MVTNPSQGALVEETVLEVIQHGQLTQWREQLIFGKNIRRFEHFSQVSDREYKVSPFRINLFEESAIFWQRLPAVVPES